MTSATCSAPSCALMHAAHQICPYSNSTRGNMDVRLLLETDTVPDALASSSR